MVQSAERIKEYRALPEVRERKRLQESLARARYKKERPIWYKARQMTGGLRLGKGGTERLEKLIINNLGKPCEYCGKELKLDNLSLDHKEPWTKSKKKTEEEMVRLNTESNLQIICLVCNRSKGNLHHEDYSALLNFLNGYPRMKQIVLAKLKGSNFMYRGR